MDQTPYIDREELLSMGFKQCVRCGHIYPVRNGCESRPKIYDWCPTCVHKYQIKNGKIKIGPGVAVTTPFDVRKQLFLEESGFKKCTECGFTLPKSEFSTRKPICSKCSDKNRGKKLITDHLSCFNLAECKTCTVIKPASAFYTNDVGKRRRSCTDCEKKNADLRANRVATKKHVCVGKSKKCTDCGVAKDLSEYGINRSCKDGLQKKCRSCHRNYTRKYNEANRQKRMDYHKKWVGQNKTSVAITKKNAERKRRSRKRNVPYAAITTEQAKYLEDSKSRIFGEESVVSGGTL